MAITVNFQESTQILNACTKKSGNLLNAPRTCVDMPENLTNPALNVWKRTVFLYKSVYRSYLNVLLNELLKDLFL